MKDKIIMKYNCSNEKNYKNKQSAFVYKAPESNTSSELNQQLDSMVIIEDSAASNP